MLGVLVHPQERIDPARLVVPDLRSVMREDVRQTPPAGDGRGCLVHERVAVNVHDVHVAKRFARFGADRKPRLELAQAKLAGQTVARTRDVVDVGVVRDVFRVGGREARRP